MPMAMPIGFPSRRIKVDGLTACGIRPPAVSAGVAKTSQVAPARAGTAGTRRHRDNGFADAKAMSRDTTGNDR